MFSRGANVIQIMLLQGLICCILNGCSDSNLESMDTETNRIWDVKTRTVTVTSVVTTVIPNTSETHVTTGSESTDSTTSTESNKSTTATTLTSSTTSSMSTSSTTTSSTNTTATTTTTTTTTTSSGCQTNNDCSNTNKPICDTSSGSCVECTAHSHCSGTTIQCIDQECEPCKVGSEGDKACEEKNGLQPYCVEKGQCGECIEHEDCAEFDNKYACGADYRCVACTGANQCPDEKGVCKDPGEDSMCVECMDSSDCKTDEKPSCLASTMSCVGCQTDEDCMDDSPVCENNDCRACVQLDGECGEGACDVENGVCVKDVVYVGDCKVEQDGSSDRPYCNLITALEKTGSREVVIRVSSNQSIQQASVSGRKVYILGAKDSKVLINLNQNMNIVNSSVWMSGMLSTKEITVVSGSSLYFINGAVQGLNVSGNAYIGGSVLYGERQKSTDGIDAKDGSDVKIYYSTIITFGEGSRGSAVMCRDDSKILISDSIIFGAGENGIHDSCSWREHRTAMDFGNKDTLSNYSFDQLFVGTEFALNDEIMGNLKLSSTGKTIAGMKSGELNEEHRRRSLEYDFQGSRRPTSGGYIGHSANNDSL